MRNLVTKLNELSVHYQDTINRCEEFIEQRFLTQTNSVLPFSKSLEPEQILPLNRNIDYLQSHAYEFFKQNCIEQLWDGMVSSFKQVATSSSNNNKRLESKKQPRRNKKNLSVKRANTFLYWPLLTNLFWLSSRFGKRKNPDGSIGFHYGIDLAALKGTPVLAAADGIVIDARYGEGYGNLVVIKHTKRMSTKYAHLHRIDVAPGMVVKRGQCIGRVGETGFIRKLTKDGSHLHFEVLDGKKRIDPMLLLPVL